MSPISIGASISQNPFVATHYLEGVADYGRKFGGFRISAFHSENVISILASLRKSQATAILSNASSRDVLRKILDLGKPVVNLDVVAFSDIVHTVACDDIAVGRVAAEHLLKRGYSYLAYYGPRYHVSDLREKGFCTAALHGRAKNVFQFSKSRCKALSWLSITSPRLIKQWLARLPRPLGLFAFNDQIAVLMLEVCESLGLHVPDDVAIIGVDNSPLHCEFSATTISSVDLGGRRIGYAAAEMLHGLIIQGTQPPCLRVLQPCGVIARRSTDATVFDDQDVRRAMRFIRDQIQSGVGVDDVVRHVNVSRSSLERKFKRAMGRLPGEEIHRERISEACRLLETSSMDLADIAAACGFSYLSNFSTSFKAAMGLPPRDYRRHCQFRVD